MMFHEYPTGTIEIGSIGWEDDDTHYDLGDNTNDGHTLVKVQLFKGRDVTQPLSPTRAQGTKITCHLNSLLGHRIPKKDTRCYVIIPPGMEQTPGAGLIVGLVEQTLDGRLDKDRAVLDYGDQHVVIKGKSVTISSNNNEFVSVGQPRAGGDPGVMVQASDGSGGIAREGVVAWFAKGSGSGPPTTVEITGGKVDIVSPAAAGGAHRCVVGNGGVSLFTPSILVLGGGTTFVGMAAGATYSTYKPLLATSGVVNPTGIWFASS